MREVMTKTSDIYQDGIWDEETNEEMIEDFKAGMTPGSTHYYIDDELTIAISPESGLTPEEKVTRDKWESDNPFEALRKAESEKRYLFDLFNETLRESLERDKKSPNKVSPTRMQVERSLVWTNR